MAIANGLAAPERNIQLAGRTALAVARGVCLPLRRMGRSKSRAFRRQSCDPATSGRIRGRPSRPRFRRRFKTLLAPTPGSTLGGGDSSLTEKSRVASSRAPGRGMASRLAVHQIHDREWIDRAASQGNVSFNPSRKKKRPSSSTPIDGLGSSPRRTFLFFFFQRSLWPRRPPKSDALEQAMPSSR